MKKLSILFARLIIGTGNICYSTAQVSEGVNWFASRNKTSIETERLSRSAKEKAIKTEWFPSEEPPLNGLFSIRTKSDLISVSIQRNPLSFSVATAKDLTPMPLVKWLNATSRKQKSEEPALATSFAIPAPPTCWRTAQTFVLFNNS